MSNLNKYFFGIFAVFTLSFTAIAQEVEEVVVTATKKSESIQDLALSIEAFTAEDVSQNMIKDSDDLAEVVPGLITAKGIGSGASYAIRGTGSYGVGAAVVGSTVTAQNGHSFNTSTFADIGFFDVSRVEVLKGPQGTLFGRNAVTGVINVITARPDSEFGGYVDVEAGNWNSKRLTTAVNIPVSDSIRTRLAVTSFQRDGFNENIRTGEWYNDMDALGVRLSLDADIGDNGTLKFNYERYEGEDNRNNIGTAFCESHALFGCNPFTVGSPNTPADSRGSTAAAFNLVAGLNSSAFVNSYAGTTIPGTIDKSFMTRIPEHYQLSEMSTLEYVTDLSDTLTMNVKYSYSTRDYQHMNDNDYSHTDNPYLGVLAAQVPLGPLSFEGCFGGFDHSKFSFCETVNSDRTYEFSTVLTTTRQTEITIISDYDGPFNFVAGLYQFDQRNHNIYQVQTAAWNLTGAFANHPYASAVYGGAFNGYGGIPFYATMVLGLQGDPTCASGALGPVAQAVPSTSNPACLGGLLAAGAALGAIPNGPYELPVQLRGYVNDDHVKTDSTALFGEMYFDLSEDTKLTIGLRYNDDEVYDSIMTCLSDQDCPNYTFDDYLAGEYQFKPTRITVADDAFAYKIALQHDLNDNQMVYASYSTAIKAGGNNPVIGTEPDPYDQEETGVFEIGTKGIFMDGAVLFNAAVFFNQTDGMLFSNLENAGSVNYNLDAEIKGFEGNLVAYLTETTRLDFNWLLVESEFTGGAILDPLNVGGVVQMLNVNANAWTPGVNGCDTYLGLCLPTGAPLSAANGVFQALPLDAAGIATYGWGLNADGENVLIAKSLGSLCMATGQAQIAQMLNPETGFNPLGGRGCPIDPVLVDLTGNKLPQSPELSYSIALNQDWETANGVVTGRVVYRFQDEREGNVFNQDRARMKEQKFWDMRVTYNPNNADWYVALYGKNLVDDRGVGTWAASSALQGGAQFGTYTDPRTWGLAFGTSF
jgi:iron complex outermembrane receptor protein